ncbi:hypothetical protein L484_002280 [Morus notabilis]|uniref:Myb/SANT-like DNA-binding domain-containing protein n=1 Tax=Morus notabilis TaxID=981085 RepID=W9RKH8_9ROSA|nr:uncharacterized protein LOC21385857 [Morus notabilis]EXB95450.1 hypothetical protein L484_002280 [Morus notabilis]
MEANGLGGGGLFSAMGSGMLGLEMPLQPQQQNPRHLQHPQMVGYAHHDPADQHPQTQPSLKHGYTYGPTSKSKQVALSDEDEAGFGADHDGTNGDGKRKMSPWQRMKWTDSMVRYLIMAVYYIGDDGGLEGTDPAAKKKPSGGLLQKKGKWKTVSRAMMEKGFHVSPQQCEDKFNDLNKRYKRVNDILGKGTSCRVVENQSLLDSMDLTPKMKEEVRKLLNSKHLFFREMCAYHNGGAHQSPELVFEPSNIHPNQQPYPQPCFHLKESAQMVGRQDTEALKMIKTGSAGEDEEEDDEDDDSDEYDEADEDEEADGGSRGQIGRGHDHDDEDNCERQPAKRPRKEALSGTTQLIQHFRSEILGVVQDGLRSPWEKKQWLKVRMLQLEEQQVSYQCEAFELEKQRLKWIKFSSKKEREMEKAKFENERRKLENERMVLIIRQKELELLDLHHRQNQQQQHSSNKRGGGDPSSITA